MASILCSIPHPVDATNLYRGTGPLQTLKRRIGNIELGINPDINWMMLKAADLVFFQRPAREDHVTAMKLCKSNCKPMWLDYDDNLHAIPLCNRRYSFYGHPQTQHNIATMIAMADVISVSTPHLAESTAKLLKCFPDNGEFKLDPAKIVVIPNAYDYELHGPLDEKRPERARLVVWRGSDSHSKDLLVHTEQMVRVVQEHQDWTYEFIGEPFWITIEQLKKVAKPNNLTLTPPNDPVSYFHYLKRQKPALMIVPLEDIGFNRSKSNIAWLESTVAGAVTLAPNWPEWQKPGVITYDSIQDFGDKMAAFLRGEYDEETLWAASRDYVRDHLPLDKVNLARAEVVNLLAGKPLLIRASSGIKPEDICGQSNLQIS